MAVLTYKIMIERIVQWAHLANDIRAVILIGSQARSERPADAWSDLDLVIVCADPARYIVESQWLQQFGPFFCTFIEKQSVGDGLERRALFDGALDIDFAVLPTAFVQELINGGLPPEFATIFARGYLFLVDKDNLVQWLESVNLSRPSPQPPTLDEFLNLCNDYFYHGVWAMKKLRRGELWVACNCVNSHMAAQLMKMLSWHSHALYGSSYDTWHSGRFLEQWADPRAVMELKQAFAQYDSVDIPRALLAQRELFRWLAIETAEQLHLTYPTESDQHTSKWMIEFQIR